MDKEIIGGIIVTISGKSYGRIDRIFILFIKEKELDHML